MTNSQKLELRASEIRQRLNEIAGMDDLSDDVRAESDRLTTEYAAVETRRRAAIIAESAGPSRSRLTPRSTLRPASGWRSGSGRRSAPTSGLD